MTQNADCRFSTNLRMATLPRAVCLLRTMWHGRRARAVSAATAAPQEAARLLPRTTVPTARHSIATGMAHRCRFLSVAIGAFMALATGHEASGVDGTPSWFFSQVAAPSTNYQITSPSLAFDHYGIPSVSWSDASNTSSPNFVYRSVNTGLGFWSHHLADSGAGVGLLTSLSFDRAERPTVAWLNSNGVVRTLFNNTTLQTVAASGANASRPALSISHDLTGTLRGAYSGMPTGNMFDINGTLGSHTSTSIGMLPGVNNVFDLRLTTDHTGRRHIATRVGIPGGQQAVMVSSESFIGGPWLTSTIATADTIKGVAIATSPVDGKIALAYTTFESTTNVSKLIYAKATGVSLNTTEVQSSNTAIFEDIDLAFDYSDGRPAIAYERRVASPFAAELRFAYENALGNWQTSLVDSTISLDSPFGHHRRPSLAFDDYGTSWPAIAYIDSDGTLKVAFDPPAPEPATAGMLLMAGLVFVLRRGRRGIQAMN